MDFLYGAKQHHLEKLFRVWLTIPKFLKVPAVDLLYMVSRARLFYMPTPIRLILYVTSRCTRRCAYCFFYDKLNENGGEDLTLDEISTMAMTIPTGIKVVTLTGGEPYLRDDLPEIAAILHKFTKVPKLSINSNGDLPDAAERTVLKILKTTNVCLNLQVSIQVPADLNSEPGETLNILKHIAEKNPRISQVSAQTTLCQSNVNLLSELSGHIQKIPNVFHKLQFLRSPSDCVFAPKGAVISDMVPPNYQSEKLNHPDRVRVIKFVEKSVKGSRYPLMSRKQLVRIKTAVEIMMNQGPLFPCQAGKVDAVIYNNGEVGICEFYKPVASLRDSGMNFKKIWASEKITAQQKLAALCACSHPCNITASMSYDRRSLHRILDV